MPTYEKNTNLKLPYPFPESQNKCYLVNVKSITYSFPLLESSSSSMPQHLSSVAFQMGSHILHVSISLVYSNVDKTFVHLLCLHQISHT